MGRTITKKELVSRIADRTGQTKVVTKEVIQLFLDEIISELGRGNRLEFREFGVFEIKERAARKAQNPRTLEKVYVPAKKVVKFKVGRTQVSFSLRQVTLCKPGHTGQVGRCPFLGAVRVFDGQGK